MNDLESGRVQPRNVELVGVADVGEDDVDFLRLTAGGALDCLALLSRLGRRSLNAAIGVGGVACANDGEAPGSDATTRRTSFGDDVIS
jgi:hypothetical protein